MRSFLAINPPENVLDHLVELQFRLRQSVHAPVAWTKRPQLHLTMKFIGEVEADSVSVLRAALASHPVLPSFDLRATALEIFPPRGPSRILAVKLVSFSTEHLEALHRLLEDVCVGLGVVRESRRFRPHVTVGRLRIPCRMPDAVHMDVALAFPGPTFRPLSFDLMKSTLAAAGATYECLHRFELT